MTIKKPRLILYIICICMALFSSLNAVAFSGNEILPTQIKHVTDEIFDGYEGLETTISGKVGFNYALKTPDGNKEILIGFNPNMANESSYYNSVYNIGTGWRIKLPFLEFEGESIYLHNTNGYKYLIENNTNRYNIIDYPSTYTLTRYNEAENELYFLEEAYGNKKYFSQEGNILKSVDAFGNTTEYLYDNDVISEIIFSDDSSIYLERKKDEGHSTISIQYNKNNDIIPFVTLNLVTDSASRQRLVSIQDNNENNVYFDYVQMNNFPDLLLGSYTIDNKYSRSIKYDAVPVKCGTSTFRIESLTTIYEDGITERKLYFYNNQGRMTKLVDGDIAEVKYEYGQSKDGSITVSTTKKYMDDISISSQTLNKYGQITKYVRDGSTLELKYNQYNKVSEEIENNLSINYSYTKQGQVDLASFSDGKQIAYSYYSNGALKKLSTNTQEIYYTPSGKIEKMEIEGKQYINNVANETNYLTNGLIQPNSSGVYVLYNINSSVGVTNFHTYYGLPQNGFNCYTFAIGKSYDLCDPGYYSGRSLDLNSLSGIKLNVEKDQESLGRGIYHTTVGATIPGHSWKIALKIRSGVDYHFMNQSTTSSAWQFKAGKSGPVMRVLSGKNPDNITWDIYTLQSGNYVVATSNFYTSAINYMMIRD